MTKVPSQHWGKGIQYISGSYTVWLLVGLHGDDLCSAGPWPPYAGTCWDVPCPACSSDWLSLLKSTVPLPHLVLLQLAQKQKCVLHLWTWQWIWIVFWYKYSLPIQKMVSYNDYQQFMRQILLICTVTDSICLCPWITSLLTNQYGLFFQKPDLLD